VRRRRRRKGAADADAVAVDGGGESGMMLRFVQRALVPTLHARQPATVAVVVAAALLGRS
jgi:hypothetical protein